MYQLSAFKKTQIGQLPSAESYATCNILCIYVTVWKFMKIYDIYFKYISYQVLREQKYISYQL